MSEQWHDPTIEKKKMYEVLVSLCDSQTSLFGDVMQASTYLNF